GAVVVLGRGAVCTGVVQAVSFRLAPVTADDVGTMLDEGARPRLLAGPRGMAAVDRAALTVLVGRVSDLIAAEPRIREIDINPVIATGVQLIAVDVLVIVDEGNGLQSE